jgi:hypothetical protein
MEKDEIGRVIWVGIFFKFLVNTAWGGVREEKRKKNSKDEVSLIMASLSVHQQHIQWLSSSFRGTRHCAASDENRTFGGNINVSGNRKEKKKVRRLTKMVPLKEPCTARLPQGACDGSQYE